MAFVDSYHPMQKTLPRELTSYDLLKTAAVVLMVIDHVGAYFIPDILWMRLAGRLCVPVWFFLIGYARSRDMGPHLWIAALVLIVSDFVAGMTIFPLNILVTILLVRLVLDPYMKIVSRHGILFWAGGFFLLFLAPPTLMVVDYGTQGLILAVFGHVVRATQDDARKRAVRLFPCLLFSAIAYTMMQWMVFGLPVMAGLILLAGTVAVLLILSDFRPAVFPHVPAFVARPLQFIGRHTLAIYVGHLLAIKALALWLLPQSFHLLGWSLFPWALMRQF